MTFPGDLADTQRSFGAYAAHEVRVEIAVQLALAESTLADPDADTAALRELGEQVIAFCQRQQRLLEALSHSPAVISKPCEVSQPTSPRPSTRYCAPMITKRSQRARH